MKINKANAKTPEAVHTGSVSGYLEYKNIDKNLHKHFLFAL